MQIKTAVSTAGVTEKALT